MRPVRYFIQDYYDAFTELADTKNKYDKMKTESLGGKKFLCCPVTRHSIVNEINIVTCYKIISGYNFILENA